MLEKLEIFNLKGKSLGTQDRDAFYSEIKKVRESVPNPVLSKLKINLEDRYILY